MEKPKFAKGTEPANIQRRIEILMPKLLEAYPNRKVVALYRDHKKWAETVHDIAQILGYSDNTSFLEDYGFKVERSNGASGRPSNDPSLIIDILKQRYSDGATCSTCSELISENSDLRSQLKTMQNRSNELFHCTLREYFMKIGILCERPKKRQISSTEDRETYQEKHARFLNQTQKKIENAIDELRRRYFSSPQKPSTIVDLKEENSDLELQQLIPHIELVYGKKPLVFLREKGILAPKTVPPVKSVVHQCPKGIQQIRKLLAEGSILRATMDGSFVYETICSTCGKRRLVYTDYIPWYVHQISCTSENHEVLENEIVQKKFEKYGVDLRLDSNLISDFKSQPGTCLCHLDAPCKIPFGDCGVGNHMKIYKSGEMSFEFEAVGTLYEGRTERIEQHRAGDSLTYCRNPQNDYDKSCIEILDVHKESLGNMPSELCNYISPLIDKKKVTISGHVASIETRAQRGKNAQKARLHCAISIHPTDCDNPLNWLLDNRIEYLKNEYGILEVAGGCKIRYTEQTPCQASDFSKLCYNIEAFLQCSDCYDCECAVERLKEGDSIAVEPIGSLDQNNFSLSICDRFDNRLGRLSDALVSTIAPLVEYGGARIIDPIYLGQENNPYALKIKPKIKFLLTIPTLGNSTEKYQRQMDDCSANIFGNPSAELRKLIIYIKAHGYDGRYELALNADGILYVLDYDHNQGKDCVVREDFGFNCEKDHGFFYLFRQVPDKDPIKILNQNCIMIGKLESIMDFLDDEDCDGYE